MKRIRPRMVVVEPWLVERTRDACAHADVAIVTPEDVRCREDRGDLDAALGAEGIALLQHSSGTTGLKKGVVLSHAAVLKQTETYAKRLRLDPSRHRIATWLPLYHDMGLIACFLMPIVTGVPFVGLDPFEWVARPWTLLETIEQDRSTHVWMPNFGFHQVARTRGGRSFSLGHVEAFINCSEPCRPDTHDLFAETFADCGVRAGQIQVCYAMAEAVFAVTQTEIGEPPRRVPLEPDSAGDRLAALGRAAAFALSAGRPLDGVDIAVVSETGAKLRDGAVGEIVISAPFLFLGYHLDPDKTAEKLRGERYFTGDLGFLKDGELFVLGRSDDLIVSRGRNFLAHEIEYATHGIEGLRPGRSIAFGYDDPSFGTQAVALVFETAHCEDDAVKALARAVKDRVWQQCDLVLNRVLPVAPGRLIKTSSGKISRDANRARFLHEISKS